MPAQKRKCWEVLSAIWSRAALRDTATHRATLCTYPANTSEETIPKQTKTILPPKLKGFSSPLFPRCFPGHRVFEKLLIAALENLTGVILTEEGDLKPATYHRKPKDPWNVETLGTYCWWKKSCTTWDVWNPINNGIIIILSGAGFQPSTVSFDTLSVCDVMPSACNTGLGFVSFGDLFLLDNIISWKFCWWPFWDGEFTWPFSMVNRDLQSGDEKVTLNHLVDTLSGFYPTILYPNYLGNWWNKSLTWFVCFCWFFYGFSNGIHHHEKPPFGRICFGTFLQASKSRKLKEFKRFWLGGMVLWSKITSFSMGDTSSFMVGSSSKSFV